MKTYTFHVSLVCHEDRRDRKVVGYEQQARSLNSAFDEAEAHFAETHPNHDACISLAGSLLPITGAKPEPRKFQTTLGESMGLDGMVAMLKAA